MTMARIRPKEKSNRIVSCSVYFRWPLLCLSIVLLPGIFIPTLYFHGLPIQLNTDLASFAESDERAFLDYEALTLAQQVPDDDVGITAGGDPEYEELDPSDQPIWMRGLIESTDAYTFGDRFSVLDDIVLFFRAEEGNLFDVIAINDLRRIEQGMEALPGWKTVCRAETFTSGTCMRPKSVTNAFFPSRDTSGVFLFDGQGEELIDDLDAGVEQLLRSPQAAWLVDRNFTFNGQKTNVARSHFAFGYPLAGYSSKGDRQSKQVETLNSFIRNELYPYLVSASSSKMRVMWYNEEASTYEVIVSAMHDAQIAGGALLFVVIAMWVYTRSFMMAMCSSLSMLYAIPLAYCVVVVLLDARTMSIFNVVSLFILAGIGADDLFVFVDIWRQSAVKFPLQPNTKGDNATKVKLRRERRIKRFQYTFSEAAFATFITSCTTSASFLANLASPVVPIRDFGLFTGVLVGCNYVALICIVPIALTTQDDLSRFWRWCCCCVSGEDADVKQKKYQPPPPVITTRESEAESARPQTPNSMSTTGGLVVDTQVSPTSPTTTTPHPIVTTTSKPRRIRVIRTRRPGNGQSPTNSPTSGTNTPRTPKSINSPRGPRSTTSFRGVSPTSGARSARTRNNTTPTAPLIMTDDIDYNNQQELSRTPRPTVEREESTTCENVTVDGLPVIVDADANDGGLAALRRGRVNSSHSTSSPSASAAGAGAPEEIQGIETDVKSDLLSRTTRVGTPTTRTTTTRTTANQSTSRLIHQMQHQQSTRAVPTTVSRAVNPMPLNPTKPPKVEISMQGASIDGDERDHKISREMGFSKLEVIMYNKVATAIGRCPCMLILLLLTVTVTFGVLDVQMVQVADELPQFFAESQNLGGLEQIQRTYFGSDGSNTVQEPTVIPSCRVDNTTNECVQLACPGITEPCNGNGECNSETGKCTCTQEFRGDACTEIWNTDALVDEDQVAWEGLYNSFGGNIWIRCSGTKHDACSCEGVQCGDATNSANDAPRRYIQRLDLSGIGLVKEISDISQLVDVINEFKYVNSVDVSKNPDVVLNPYACVDPNSCREVIEFPCTLPIHLVCTNSPTKVPTVHPTGAPSLTPSQTPTSQSPTLIPTTMPTLKPTQPPSVSPTEYPTVTPSTSTPTTQTPTTLSPTSSAPTSAAPTTSTPTTQTPTTLSPTSSAPTSAAPTNSPPTLNPTTGTPTTIPTLAPSGSPTTIPTPGPVQGSSSAPTRVPVIPPTQTPSTNPTKPPTNVPSLPPSGAPSQTPTSSAPTSLAPTNIPTDEPTSFPTKTPTSEPTAMPSKEPSAQPTAAPQTLAPTRPPSSDDATLAAVVMWPSTLTDDRLSVNFSYVLTAEDLLDPDSQTYPTVSIPEGIEEFTVNITTNENEATIILEFSRESSKLTRVLIPTSTGMYSESLNTNYISEGKFGDIQIKVKASDNSTQLDYGIRIFRERSLECETDCGKDGSCYKGACFCDLGFTGDACEKVDVPCSVPCEHGSCYSDQCTCEDEYTGDMCDTLRCPNDCLGNGFCGDTVAGECACFLGWEGNNCSIADESVSQLPDSRTESVSISFGLLGSDRKTGALVFDSNFDLDRPETQSMLVKVCDDLDALSDANKTDLSFRRMNSCIMRSFATEFVPEVGRVFPFTDPTEFRTTMQEYVQTNPGMRKHLSIETETLRIQRVTISIKTGFDEQMGAASAMEAKQIWDDWIEEYNMFAPEYAMIGMQSCFLWARSATESAAIRGGIIALAVSTLSAFVAILIFTGNILIALFTSGVIVSIVVCLLGFTIVILQRDFGTVEALAVTVFLGMSVDYCLHLGHAYNSSHAQTRYGKVRYALAHLGGSILGAAVTTVGAALFLMLAKIQIFVLFGLILAVDIGLSIFVSVFLFGALLMLAGPIGRCGSIVPKCMIRSGEKGKAKVVIDPSTNVLPSAEGGGGQGVSYEGSGEEGSGDTADWDGASRSHHTGVPWIHQTNQTGSVESSPVPLSVIWHDAAR